MVFLQANPKCYSCGEKSTVVDHLIPHKGNFKLFWKADNYLPICERDHNTVTNLFDRNHSGELINPKKIEWLNDQRQMNDLSFKVKVVPFGTELTEWLMKNQQEEFMKRFEEDEYGGS